MSSCSPCCKPSKFNVACWIIITFIGACQILAFALQVRSHYNITSLVTKLVTIIRATNALLA